MVDGFVFTYTMTDQPGITRMRMKGKIMCFDPWGNG